MFVPCSAPLASGASRGTASCSCMVSAGILKTIQCVISVVAFGMCASGSCRMRTKAMVPLGGFIQRNAGDTPVEIFLGPPGGGVVAEQVYCVGILPPSLNDALEITSVGPGGGGAGGAACCAAAERLAASTTAKTTIDRTISFFIPRFPFPSRVLRQVGPFGIRLFLVADVPDGVRTVVGDHKRTIGRHRDTHGTAPDFALLSNKACQEVLILACRLAVLERNEYHFVAGANRAVPGAVFGGKDLTLISLGELRRLVKGQLERRVVRFHQDVGDNHLVLEFRMFSGKTGILIPAGVIPRPAVKSPFLNMRNVIGREIVAELVAFVHRHPDLARAWLHRETDRVANPGRVDLQIGAVRTCDQDVGAVKLGGIGINGGDVCARADGDEHD